jgi:tetratricopeptide (TPR) repeat protein
MASETDQKNSLWLVKSGDRILGPFATEEINELLRAREIVVIDEAAPPQSRWRYLRDISAFAPIVEEIRKNLMNSREDTEVQNHTPTQTFSSPHLNHSQNSTHTSHSTQPPQTPSQASLLDATQSAQTASVMQSSTEYDAHDVIDAEFTEDNLKPRASKQGNDVKKYGWGSDQSVREKIHRTSRLIQALTVVVLVCMGLVAYKYRTQVPTEVVNQHESFKRSLVDAEAAWANGDFKRALLLYRHADQLMPGNPDVVVRLAPLMMKLEGETVAAKRSLQDLTERTADSGVQMDAKLGLGLAAMISEDYSEAEKIYMQILALNPNQVIAHFNLGVSKFQRANYKDAITQFSEAIRVSPDLPAAHLMLALTYISENPSEATLAAKALEPVLARQFDFNQEAQILSTWVTLSQATAAQGLVVASLALNSDPFVTSEHFHDPWLYLDVINAGRFGSLCKDIQARLKNNVGAALLGICLTNAHQAAEAEQVLRNGIAVKPEDPYLQAANAYFLMVAGREADAKAALKLAGSEDSSRLSLILSSRLCAQSHDEVCAKAAWLKLVAHDPPSLEALVGLATQAQVEGNQSQAKQYLFTAQALSPRYLPAIRLAEKVSSQ